MDFLDYFSSFVTFDAFSPVQRFVRKKVTLHTQITCLHSKLNSVNYYKLFALILLTLLKFQKLENCKYFFQSYRFLGYNFTYETYIISASTYPIVSIYLKSYIHQINVDTFHSKCFNQYQKLYFYVVDILWRELISLFLFFR